MSGSDLHGVTRTKQTDRVDAERVRIGKVRNRDETAFGDEENKVGTHGRRSNHTFTRAEVSEQRPFTCVKPASFNIRERRPQGSPLSPLM